MSEVWQDRDKPDWENRDLLKEGLLAAFKKLGIPIISYETFHKVRNGMGKAADYAGEAIQKFFEKAIPGGVGKVVGFIASKIVALFGWTIQRFWDAIPHENEPRPDKHQWLPLHKPGQAPSTPFYYWDSETQKAYHSPAELARARAGIEFNEDDAKEMMRKLEDLRQEGDLKPLGDIKPLYPIVEPGGWYPTEKPAETDLGIYNDHKKYLPGLQSVVAPFKTAGRRVLQPSINPTFIRPGF